MTKYNDAEPQSRIIGEEIDPSQPIYIDPLAAFAGTNDPPESVAIGDLGKGKASLMTKRRIDHGQEKHNDER